MILDSQKIDKDLTENQSKISMAFNICANQKINMLTYADMIHIQVKKKKKINSYLPTMP